MPNNELPEDETRIIPKSAVSRKIEALARKATDPSQKWVIEDLFEVGEIHLLTGPSGSGKSTWFLNTIYEWAKGKDVLGHTSFPKPYVYIVCDRTLSMTFDTLKRIGLENWDIPMFTIDELQAELKGEVITLEKIADMLPWVKVFFIEAIGWFEPSHNSRQMGYTESLKYWSSIRGRFAKRGLTIIATTHSPKAKGKDRYGHSRERVIGSAATGGACATIVTFDFSDETNATDEGRIITISPRNSKNLVLHYTLDEHGVLQYKDVFEGEQKEDEKGIYLVHKEFSKCGLKEGDILDIESLKGIRERTGIARSTFARIVKDLVDEGILRKIKLGTYRLSLPIARMILQ